MSYSLLCLAASLGLIAPDSAAVAAYCQASQPSTSTPEATSGQVVTVPSEPMPVGNKTAASDQGTALLQLTNAERQQAGLPALTLSSSLTQAAQRHAEDMVRSGNFSHTGSDGSQPSDRAVAAGYSYSYVGENIAAGNSTPQQTIQQWMDSPGHRANILKPEFTEVGFGYVSDPSSPYRHYWVQVFGRPQ